MTVLFTDSLEGFGYFCLASGSKDESGKPFALFKATGENGDTIERQITVPADGKWHMVSVPVMKGDDGRLYMGETTVTD